jgi:hypothetical protein
MPRKIGQLLFLFLPPTFISRRICPLNKNTNCCGQIAQTRSPPFWTLCYGIHLGSSKNAGTGLSGVLVYLTSPIKVNF